MIDLILSLIGGFKGLIVGAIGLLGGIWALWAKRKIGKQAETIAEQDRAISTYQVKEKIYQNDLVWDANLGKQMGELQEKVDNAETPEAGAGEVSGAINDYFGGKPK